LDQAIAAWERLQKLRPTSSLVPAAAYWTARVHGLQGDKEGEARELAAVLTKWPASGYAWFAAERTGVRFEAQSPVEAPPWPDSLAHRTEVVRSEALLDAGFRHWAAAELAPIKKAASQGGRDTALAAAWKFIAVGEYRAGRSLAMPYCVKPWKEGDNLAKQACTPRPEEAIVRGVTTKYALEPLLPFGIMNAESGLDPSVTSLAGARGLMQLMPKEAPRIHEQLYDNDNFNADNLYHGPYNASLGTAELGLKQQELGTVLSTSSLPAVIASYNAGIEPVRRWLSAYGERPTFDDFTEDIGYTETRRYVKRVLGFLLEYRMVYGDLPAIEGENQ
ncbi:MAG: transglycosylase SLT domain-containing protein, partial [Proteobacteria bacterium]|nr:transglycosylase SLT domain-containing protein [Pseudomonadota bacterium]